MFPPIPDPTGPFPPLPNPLPNPLPDPTPQPPVFNPIVPVQPTLPRPWPPINWQIRSLRHGCYLLRYQQTGVSTFFHFDGTMRVQRDGTNTIASGDLYFHRALPVFQPIVPIWPPRRISFQPVKEPDPSQGIPVFPRSRYRYYLRVTQILEFITFANSFTLGFERHRFDHATNSWTNEGAFTAVMTWMTAPAGYPAGADYLEGDVKDSAGNVVGHLKMGWISPYLRKATIEVDRVSQSEFPSDNGSGVDWQDVYDQVGWQVNVYESDTNLNEPSGQSWSDAELHAAMLNSRDSANLDTEWRYHLICVRRLDSTSRGIMYDAGGTDSNNIPREGAAIASHWMIPNTNTWGTVAGQRFGAADAPYFRTAVHELGHAMGLRHNTADTGFMNTTGVIASSPGTFPSNVQWSFNEADAKKLRHMPDAWIRPGEIPWAPSYSDPISPNDMLLDVDQLSLSVSPLMPVVPIGAPVRVHLELTNNGDEPVVVPDSLSLKTEYVTGTVTDSGGTVRTFRTIIRCLEEEELEVLESGASKQHDLTLLRGAEGALFPSAGTHQITVNVTWEVNGMLFRVSGTTAVMVSGPVNDAHAEAALKVLSTPDALLTLAIGGDHLEKGVAAIEAGFEDEVLRPHYAVTQAKRVGTRFGDRPADVEAALDCIDASTVISGSEIRNMAELVQKTKKAERKEGVVYAAITTLQDKAEVVPADDSVTALTKRL